MRRKTFAAGGEVREGQHEGIDNATRERARAWREMGSPERVAEPAPRRARPKPVAKAAPKAAAPAPRAERDPEIPDLDELRTANAAPGKGGINFSEVGRQASNSLMAIPGLAAGAAAVRAAPALGKLAGAAVQGLRAGKAEAAAERAVGAAKDAAASAARREAGRSKGRPDAESRFADEGNPNFGGATRAAAREPARKSAATSKGRPDEDSRFADEGNPNYARGGMVKGRGDGCAVRGHTKGRMR